MRNNGFTLIELMISMLILAVLSAIAVPSFRDFIGNSRVTGATNDFVTALNVARSTALQRAVPVVVCASADLQSCSGSTNWATGWIAFTDNAGVVGVLDGGLPAVGGDQLLQTWPALKVDMTATGTTNFVRYEVTGGITPAAGVATGTNLFTYNVRQTSCASGKPKMGRTVVKVIGSLYSDKVNCP